jgi:hypothetical protein
VELTVALSKKCQITGNQHSRLCGLRDPDFPDNRRVPSAGGNSSSTLLAENVPDRQFAPNPVGDDGCRLRSAAIVAFALP